VKLTIHLHLVPRLRMRGAIAPLPQYACMAWYSVKKLTSSMVQDITWKADCHSACQKISYLMEPEGSLPCSHKPATGPQLNPVRPTDPYFPKVHLNVILPPTPRSCQWSLSFGRPNQNIVNTYSVKKHRDKFTFTFPGQSHL
jgi:hypothetical protein